MQVGLLEDDIAIQEMFLLVLQDEGHTVLNFSDAESCLRILGVSTQEFGQVAVDLMIVDWRLGGTLLGTEVIRQIRRDPRMNNLPIILTTAAIFHDTETLNSLHISLLEKPFSVDEVTSLIKELTSQPSSL